MCDFCSRPSADELTQCRCFHFFCDNCANVGCADDPGFTICDFCPKCSTECEIKNFNAAVDLAKTLDKAPEEPVVSIPTEFQCPITRDLMNDPVVLSDGFSYERQSAVQWLSTSKISPMTGAEVDVRSITPNTVLRVLINDWKRLNKVV